MENIQKFILIVTSIIVVLVAVAFVLVAPASALMIGHTPTPTPSPTPKIIYVTVLVTPPPTPVPVPTPTPTPLPGSGLWKSNQIKAYPVDSGGIGIIYIARGDGGVISRQYPNSTLTLKDPNETHKEVHFWLLGAQNNLDRILDDTSDVVIDSQDVYHIYLTPLQTSGLKAGTYYSVIQSAGANGKMDVTYDQTNNRLVSIYASVEAVPLLGDSPSKIQNKLLTMLQNPEWSDDQYEVIETRVEDPWVSIDDSYTDGDTTNPVMHLSGATNVGLTHSLYIMIDPDNQITDREKADATRRVTITKSDNPIYSRNLWSYNFSTNGLYPGPHDILMKIPDFNIETTTTFNLVEQAWPRLTPTPPPKRYITGMPTEVTLSPIGGSPTQLPAGALTYGAPIAHPQTPVATDVTTSPPVETPSTGSYVVVGTPGDTAVPTATKALFLNANSSSPIGSSLKAMPLEPAVAILGLLACFLIMRRDD